MEPTKDPAHIERKRFLKRRKAWMRNKPCPCGSGKKFKKCCWSKTRTTLKNNTKEK